MELQRAIDQAKDGDVIQVPKGVHPGALVIGKSLTLRGEGPGRSVLDAEGLGACVLIDGETAKVTLQGLTLRRGASPEGGCIAFRFGEWLEVEDCVLEEGQAASYGGGGARLAGHRARLVRTRIQKCSGLQGGGLLADELCEVELWACVLHGNTATQGGALRIKEGAKVTAVHCSLAGNRAQGQGPDQSPLGEEIVITGTQTRMPSLRLVNSIVAPKSPATPPIASFGRFPGEVSAAHCLFPAASQELAPKGPGVLFGAPEFMPQGQHRLALSPASPAVGAGDASATPPGLTDPLGNPLAHEGRAPIGAYAG